MYFDSSIVRILVTSSMICVCVGLFNKRFLVTITVLLLDVLGVNNLFLVTTILLRFGCVFVSVMLDIGRFLINFLTTLLLMSLFWCFVPIETCCV